MAQKKTISDNNVVLVCAECAPPEPELAPVWFFPGRRQRLVSRIEFEKADIEWDSADYLPGDWPSDQDASAPDFPPLAIR